tara:strand:- start:1232 stop:1558 length:327 start_codon:yes stop_codon:yes gene_type:complete
MCKQTKVFCAEYQQDWIVRLIMKGQKYGRDWCLTHNEDQPLIEFYMADQNVKRATSKTRGFVSRYYLETLTEKNDAHLGLCLHGGGRYEASINIGGKALEKALTKLQN